MLRFLIFVGNLLFTSPGLAGSVNVAQWIPWGFVTQTWGQQSIAMTHQQERLQLSWQELRPLARGIDFRLNGSLSKTQFNAQGIAAEAQDIAATLNIQELSIDQIVKINLNGNVISIRLEARCTPLQITIPRFSLQASAVFVSELSYWRPELDDLSLVIPEAGWKISPFSCSGVGGIGEEISNRLNRALQDPQVFREQILQWLAPQIQRVWNEGWNELVESAQDQLTILGMDAPSDEGVVLVAQLSLATTRQVGSPAIRPNNLSATVPQLIFSQASVEALLEDRLLAMIPRQYNLQDVEGFRSLMGSRLLQSFVWPDLRRFSSNTPFYVVPRPSAGSLVLRGLKAEMTVEGSLQTFIQNAVIDYMNWGLSLKTDMTLEVKDSVLKIKAGKPTTHMVTHFSGLYVLLYRPNQKLSSSILQDAVQGFFKATTFQQNLPTLQLQNRIWKLQNWQQRDELITMDWQE